MFEEPIDYKSIPSNPLKDLMAFEERIQHNMNSLHRLRFQALLRITLALTGCFLLLYFYIHQWPSALKTSPWLSWLCLVGSGLFGIMAVSFIIHTLYTRRLTLLNRYHSQCRKVLRIYNMDLRDGLDPKHLASASSSALPKVYQTAIEANAHNRYFLTIKRRVTGRAHDLLDAYRLEYWKRKLKKKQS